MPSFHPPIRPVARQPGQQSQPAEPLGWMQQLAAQDDLLLWVTAALGVLMPGVIYIVYHKVHAAYMRYATRKEATRLAEEKAKEALAIFYTRGMRETRVSKEGESVEEIPHSEWRIAERRARQLEEFMGEEKPMMRAIEDLRLDEFGKYIGFAIFLVECTDTGHAQESYEWFLDWLETVAADKKERKKLQTGEMKYAILGMSSDGKIMLNRAAETLSKRLRILGASSVVPDRNFDKECEGYDPEELFRVWAEDLFLAIDRYGIEEEDEYEDEEETEEEVDVSEGESEGEMVNDPIDEGMRRRNV
ncbi:hypothetical protein PFISCL1PPCAC_11972, partial [Pristionchus fissidentatus]